MIETMDQLAQVAANNPAPQPQPKNRHQRRAEAALKRRKTQPKRKHW